MVKVNPIKFNTPCSLCGKKMKYSTFKDLCAVCGRRKRQQKAPKILCACNCGEWIPNITLVGKPMKFKYGHNTVEELNWAWKGGTIEDGHGYLKTLCPKHPFAAKDGGYVRTHRLALEKHYSEIYGFPIFILPYFDVHHRDNDKKNNDWRNLQMVTRRQHQSIHHPKIDMSGRICVVCKTHPTYGDWYKFDKKDLMCSNCYQKRRTRILRHIRIFFSLVFA